MSSVFAEFGPTILKLRRGGMGWVDIAAELRAEGFIDAHPEAIRGWHRRRVLSTSPRLMETPAQQRKMQVTEEDYAALAPIILVAPTPPACATSPTETTVVAGDFHFGPDSNSPECEEILLNVVKDLRPKAVVLNGDLPDMLAISRYPKDVRLRVDLGEERRQMHRFLYRLHETVAPWSGKIVETNANHSGESQESRWWRYLSDRVPELAGSPEFQPQLTYKAMWYPEWANIEVVDYFPICEGLIAIHGDLVRSQAGYTAKAMLEKWRHNLVHGHTHRMGATGYRVPAVAGKEEHQMRAFEGACMCNLTPTYGSGSATNWQNGFMIFRHDDEGNFGAEQVLIHKGLAVVNTLGQTYRSSE